MQVWSDVILAYDLIAKKHQKYLPDTTKTKDLI